MDLKQFLMKKIGLFFTLTTLITIAIYVLGSTFDSEAQFGYDAYLSPLIFAGACILPTFATYSKRELKRKELLSRMFVEWILIEAVVLSIAYFSPTIHTDERLALPMLAVSVLVIYVVVCLFDWLKESAEAKKMNADLAKLQSLQKM